MIDWGSEESHVLLNPRLPGEKQKQLHRIAGQVGLRAHVWIATSGTTTGTKLCALSKKAILASAAAVNRHLGATSKDGWCCVLPTFHVGGLGIYARAALLGAPVFAADWNPTEFVDLISRTGAAFASLVPAQVFELTEKAPPRLRAVVVGGAALSEDLYQRARSLGWNLLPSYGMTECASQVATAPITSLTRSEFPDLELLSHLQARRGPDGRLAFAGDSLLTGYALDSDGTFVNPKVDGWFISEDYGRVDNAGGHTMIRVEGRGADFLKIGGELVSFSRLESLLESILRRENLSLDASLVALPDDRLGHIIALAVSGEISNAQKVIEAFNQQVLPFERIRRTVSVARIPRSRLGKVERSELLRLISS